MELRDYQKRDLEFELSHDRCMNLSEPGTGKSPTFSRYIYMRYIMNGVKTAFIMPGGIMKKNQEDVCEWTGWDESEVVIVGGGAERRAKQYSDPNVKCWIISADTFAKEWREIPCGCVVVDESHLMYAGHASARTQALYASSRKIKYFLFNTGSILNGKFSSAYPAIAICEPRYYMNYQNFLATHAVYDTWGRIVAWSRPEKLRRVLRALSVRHTFKECYPNSLGYVMFYETAEIDPVLKENYIQLEKEALLELSDENLDCGNPAVQAMRARQLLSCPEVLDLERKPKKNGKDELLKVHLQNAKEEGARLLIFSVFQAEQKRILNLCEEIGLRAGLINGSVSNKKRGEVDVNFRAGSLDVVVASPQTASIGFNFEFAKEVIFMSMDYQDSSFEQGIARLDRGSRGSPVPVYVIGYKTKVEKRIFDIVRRKMQEKGQVFGI